MFLHFQKQFINFIFTNIFSFDVKMIEAIKDGVRFRTTGKWSYCESIPLQYLLSTYHRLPMWNIAKNMVISVRMKKNQRF